MTGCFSGKGLSMAGKGGEVVGVGGGRAFSEPTPYGMVKVERSGERKHRRKTYPWMAFGWMKPR